MATGEHEKKFPGKAPASRKNLSQKTCLDPEKGLKRPIPEEEIFLNFFPFYLKFQRILESSGRKIYFLPEDFYFIETRLKVDPEAKKSGNYAREFFCTGEKRGNRYDFTREKSEAWHRCNEDDFSFAGIVYRNFLNENLLPQEAIFRQVLQNKEVF